jgi:DNA ligase D-like protein (predicted 3'-phosphoesterase)
MPTRRDPLAVYRSRRRFDRTAEPAPSPRRARPAAPEPRFVIQKHAATRLHYDLRLEVDGVLASWAVPKGPSTDPRDKRLAIRTEDHPLAYADFEGVIPAGEYGGGTVLVWDSGIYRNLLLESEDPERRRSMAEALRDGHVEVVLLGQKLRGAFALIRTKREQQWLLVKMKDAYADPTQNVTAAHPASVLSGKDLEEIAAEQGR